MAASTSTLPASASSSTSTTIVSEDEKRRKDGRTYNQLRELAAEVGLLNRADGSASLSHGQDFFVFLFCPPASSYFSFLLWLDQTAVLVAVYGPREVSSRKEVLGKCVLDVTFRPRSGLVTNRDTERERMLQSVLEQIVMTALHPRSIVSVVVQVLSDDGSVALQRPAFLFFTSFHFFLF